MKKQKTLEDFQKSQQVRANPNAKRIYETVCEIRPKKMTVKAVNNAAARQIKAEGIRKPNGDAYKPNSMTALATQYRDATGSPDLPLMKGQDKKNGRSKTKRKSSKKQTRVSEVVTEAAHNARPLNETPLDMVSPTLSNSESYELAERVLSGVLTPADKVKLAGLLLRL